MHLLFPYIPVSPLIPKTTSAMIFPGHNNLYGMAMVS